MLLSVTGSVALSILVVHPHCSSTIYLPVMSSKSSQLPSIPHPKHSKDSLDLKLSIPKRYNDVQPFPSPVTPDSHLVTQDRAAISRISSVKRPSSVMSMATTASSPAFINNSCSDNINDSNSECSIVDPSHNVGVVDSTSFRSVVSPSANSHDHAISHAIPANQLETGNGTPSSFTPPLCPSPFPASPATTSSRATNKRVISEYQPTARPIPHRGASEGSNISTASSGTTSTSTKPILHREKTSTDTQDLEYVHHVYDANNNLCTWRELGTIGRGGFSRVMLGGPVERHVQAKYRAHCPDYLVAIKVVELNQNHDHGVRHNIVGGLLREVEILRSLDHPNVIHLLGFNMDDVHAVLIESYCCGGDLFELASQNRHVLTPDVVARVFGEVASAVAFLHANNVVHRDIKLENVLLNVNLTTLEKWVSSESSTPTTPVAILTDFGLSRRIDPNHPLLDTRCGSEDYVPPELLMGQRYDGRQMDTWALGVLLYAILEGQLPFDGPNDMSRRRISHRIARIEWTWSAFSSESTEWLDAMSIVEACLRRRDSRITAADICNKPWIKNAVLSGLSTGSACPPLDLFTNNKNKN